MSVMSLASKYKEGDGLPQKYAKLLWQQAYAQGIIDRPFNDSRWSAMWKTVAACGFMDVQDDTYWYYRYEDKPGKCMEWRLRLEYSWYEQAQERERESYCNRWP
jgi:hypothetical protein